MLRLVVMCLGFLALTACTNPNDLDEPPAKLGNFQLGHNVVVAPKMVKGPVSREATEEEWVEALTKAIDDRFRRYEGGKLYHFGVSVEGYVLAQTGIPLVMSPKSVLIINFTLWDDAAQKKLTEAPEQLTVLETISGETFLGSGLMYTREQQLENLSQNAAKVIENWLLRNPQWFEAEVEAASDAAGQGVVSESAGAE